MRRVSFIENGRCEFLRYKPIQPCQNWEKDSISHSLLSNAHFT